MLDTKGKYIVDKEIRLCYISVYSSIRRAISDTDSQYNEPGFVPYQLKNIIHSYCNILWLTINGIFIFFLIKRIEENAYKDVIDDNLKLFY